MPEAEDDAATTTKWPSLPSSPSSLLPKSSSQQLAEKMTSDWAWLKSAFSTYGDNSRQQLHTTVSTSRSRVQSAYEAVQTAQADTEARITQLTTASDSQNGATASFPQNEARARARVLSRPILH